jgi:hypothetical protein
MGSVLVVHGPLEPLEVLDPLEPPPEELPPLDDVWSGGGSDGAPLVVLCEPHAPTESAVPSPATKTKVLTHEPRTNGLPMPHLESDLEVAY